MNFFANRMSASGSAKIALGVGVFLIVFASMLFTIDVFGLSIPFYDEWDAEAFALYLPYVEGRFSLSLLFEPHNGHRILFTRATAMALFILNEGWDPELQMMVNAFLHAVTGAVLVSMFLSQSQRPLDKLVACVLLLLFSIPFSWMSILVAFQTQFYFMVLFSVLSIRAFFLSKYLSGHALATCAFLSMTPGAFVLLAYGMCLIINAIRLRLISKEMIIQVCLCLALFSIMLLSRSGQSTTDQTVAESVSDFAVSLIAALWWPFNASNIAGLLVYLPVFVLTVRAFFDAKVPLVYIALGFFVLLQIVAMAYFRGADGVPPANRYWEVLLLGVCANFLCLLEVYRAMPSRTVFFASLIWALVMAYGMLLLTIASTTSGLPGRKAQNTAAQIVLIDYLESRDEAVFDGKSNLDISYPDSEKLVQFLSAPRIRDILPSTLVPMNTDNLTAVKQAMMGSAPVLLILGLCMYFCGLVGVRRAQYD